MRPRECECAGHGLRGLKVADRKGHGVKLFEGDAGARISRYTPAKAWRISGSPRSRRTAHSPNDGRRVAGNQIIRRDDRHALQDSLRDEASIKRVAVMARQQRVVRGAILIECERP